MYIVSQFFCKLWTSQAWCCVWYEVLIKYVAHCLFLNTPPPRKSHTQNRIFFVSVSYLMDCRFDGLSYFTQLHSITYQNSRSSTLRYIHCLPMCWRQRTLRLKKLPRFLQSSKEKKCCGPLKLWLFKVIKFRLWTHWPAWRDSGACSQYTALGAVNPGTRNVTGSKIGL